MKQTGYCALSFALGLAPAVADTVLVGSEAPKPFIQRISAADFIALESRLGQALLKSCTLVIYRPAGDGGWSAIGIGASSRGTRELISLRTEVNSDAAEPKISQQRVAIQTEIAAQIEQSFQLILERNVYAPSNQAEKVTQDDSYCWILLRVDQTQAIAGIALAPALHQNNSEFSVVFREILYGMRDVIGAPDDERNSALLALDRLTARFVLTEKPRR